MKRGGSSEPCATAATEPKPKAKSAEPEEVLGVLLARTRRKKLLAATKVWTDGAKAGAAPTASFTPPRDLHPGVVADFDASAKTFSVNGYSVTVDSATTYESGDEAIDEATFFSADRSGVECEVKGAVDGLLIRAIRIELEDEAD